MAAFSESFDAGQRVATQGEALAAIYFVSWQLKKTGVVCKKGGGLLKGGETYAKIIGL